MSKKNLVSILLVVIGIVITSCSSESGVSCPRVKNGGFTPSSTSLDIFYEGNQEANSYRVEYGPTGFTQGAGVSQTTSNSYFSIPNLTPSTTYDVFITSICSAEGHSQAYKMSSLTTNPSQCTGTASLSFFQYNTTSIDLNCSYTDSNPQKYDIEYGVHGFTLGTGTKVSTTTSQSTLTVTGIQSATNYDFYIRASCYQTDVSAYTKFEYTTIESCPKPNNLNTYNVSGACNYGSGETRAFSWSYPYGAVASYTISIVTIDNINNPDAGNTNTTSTNGISFSGMYCLWKAFYVKANCLNGSSSSWAGPYYFN